MFNRRRHRYSSFNDEELLIRFKSKPNNAIMGEYYLRYGHLVMGVALKYLKNTSDAEDMAMIIFEKLPEKLAKHSINNFKSWLYSVVKNECLMRLRKKDFASSEFISELEQKDELQEVILLERQLEILEQSIEALNEEQQICIRMFYLEKKSYQEIANEIKLDTKKIKSAIQNGKRNLKIKLEENHEFKSSI